MEFKSSFGIIENCKSININVLKTKYQLNS
jgi:hypothetical protein